MGGAKRETAISQKSHRNFDAADGGIQRGYPLGLGGCS